MLAATVGCAAAYHAYPCGNVPCGYCPPPPLPYAAFDACPTPMAADYMSGKKADLHGSDLEYPAVPDVIAE